MKTPVFVRRKEKLNARANQYATKSYEEWLTDASSVQQCIAHSYERGYRDALKDARKVIREGYNSYSRDLLTRQFLRPLR